MPKGYYHRKSRVVPFQHLVRREVELDPTVPMQVVREDLQAIVERYGGNVEALRTEVVDEVVRMRKERSQTDNATGDPVSVDTIDAVDVADSLTEDEETIEDANTPAVLIPSVAALNSFLRGESGMDVLREIPVFTMKRETVRGASANTPENKEARYNAVVKLQEKMLSGYTWVCLDETSWVIGSTPVYGRSERGKKCFITKGPSGLRLTSVAAIDGNGISYCNVATGTNTMETFNAYLRRLVAKYDERGLCCVFWCDNCSIHRGIEDVLRGTRHCVVFNAAYSPELNLIEHFFGIWKDRAEKNIREWSSLQGFLGAISEAFTTIESSSISSLMERCRTVVWPAVIQREDL